MGRSSNNSRWADVSGVFNLSQACHSLCSPIFPNHFNIHTIQTVTLKMDNTFLQNAVEQIYHTCKPKRSSFTLLYNNDGRGKLKTFIPVVQITGCHNSEGRYLHSHRCKNLKSRNYIQLVHKHLPCDSTNTNTNTSNTKAVGCLCHYSMNLVTSTRTDIACQVDNQHFPDVPGTLADKHNTWQWSTFMHFLRHIWTANSRHLFQNNFKLEKYMISHNEGNSNQ
jgi:hypothetical protein